MICHLELLAIWNKPCPSPPPQSPQKRFEGHSRSYPGVPLSGRRRRPTLPHCGAVPSARPGLTSLFGMGRGGTPGLKPPEYGFTARRLGRGRVGMTCGNRRGRDEALALWQAPKYAPFRQSWRAISNARLWRRRLCTCILSTSSSATAL